MFLPHIFWLKAFDTWSIPRLYIYRHIQDIILHQTNNKSEMHHSSQHSNKYQPYNWEFEYRLGNLIHPDTMPSNGSFSCIYFRHPPNMGPSPSSVVKIHKVHCQQDQYLGDRRPVDLFQFYDHVESEKPIEELILLVVFIDDGSPPGGVVTYCNRYIFPHKYQ